MEPNLPPPPSDLPQPPPAPLPSYLQPAPESRSAWARRSVTLKLVAIALLTLVLLVPLLLLRGLVNERERMRDSARADVSASWGAPQAVEGPVLSIPVERPARDDKGAIIPNAAPEITWVHFLPDSLSVDGALTPEIRRSGIFDVVLYTTTARVAAQFPAPSFDGLVGVTGTPRLDRAVLQLGIPDLKGVEETIRMNWGPLGSDSSAVYEATSGLPVSDLFGSGVSVAVPLQANASGYAFSTDLVLNGSSRFDVQPLGKETTVHLKGAWATVGYSGAFLPDVHNRMEGQRTAESDTTFDANWKVLAINRDYPQRIVGRQNLSTNGSDVEAMARAAAAYDGGNVNTSGSAFGVELKLPVDAYQKTMRSAEYGLLFVLLTFATFFFVEVLGGRRIHPVQYLLVGFAVCLFYLMLLAFAEYLPFNAAYGLAAAMILAMIFLYTRAIFHDTRLAAMVTGLLALFYVYFFVLLQLEELALLVGALGLFVILGGLMYLSRKVDWYGLAEPTA